MTSATDKNRSNAGKSKWVLLTLVFVVLLFLAALQVAVVSASLYFASANVASIEQPDNYWLNFAEILSTSNPDVLSARADFLRQKSLLVAFKEQKPNLLHEALMNLSQASEIRPLWPYYPLAELNLLVLLDADIVEVQQKVEQIITLAPNERGLDKHFLELGFHSWVKLTAEQQKWMIARLAIVPRRTLNYVYLVAKSLNQAAVICTRLPYSKIKKICKTR
ncbi:MAG: hypothetical protein ACI910_000384 [Oleispira sp.]|jgi:hypothetical protein